MMATLHPRVLTPWLSTSPIGKLTAPALSHPESCFFHEELWWALIHFPPGLVLVGFPPWKGISRLSPRWCKTVPKGTTVCVFCFALPRLCNHPPLLSQITNSHKLSSPTLPSKLGYSPSSSSIYTSSSGLKCEDF